MDSTHHSQRFVFAIWLLSLRTSLTICTFADMNISVKETTVFSVFHPDAQDLYNTCSDLKKVIWQLWDPALRLGDDVRQLSLILEFYCNLNSFGLYKRTKQCSFSEPLRLCCANGLRGRSKIPSVRCQASSSSKRSWTARGCRCIRGGMNSSTAPGPCYISRRSPSSNEKLSQERKELYIPLWSTCRCWKFDSVYRQMFRPQDRRVRIIRVMEPFLCLPN